MQLTSRQAGRQVSDEGVEAAGGVHASRLHAALEQNDLGSLDTIATSRQAGGQAGASHYSYQVCQACKAFNEVKRIHCLHNTEDQVQPSA
jgi:hypothetical protein